MTAASWRQNVINLLAFDPMNLEMDVLQNYKKTMKFFLKQGENLPIPSTESIMVTYCYQNIDVNKI